MSAINWHFWLATIGIVLHASSMWVSGIMEGLMWREVDAQGFLVKSFADTVSARFPMYVVRGLGGVLYLTGGLIMVWNIFMTIRGGASVTAPVSVPAEYEDIPMANDTKIPDAKNDPKVSTVSDQPTEGSKALSRRAGFLKRHQMI
jgi:uncharacterized membrane protein YedE/YeeE